ncbi:MAG TPA: hypothetical protein VJ867_01295 [Gemmatimonadaceae bacterium]|nr:hypothetical protein [Gemmatimonadaceae bacterium]
MERRYSDDEVAEIFSRAAEAQNAPPRLASGETSEGLTLTELQDIGREVGIEPEVIARAASTLAVPRAIYSRYLLGFPVGVARTVELGRKLTDEEWEHLVVDLRETFDARGRLRYDGGFKQWTNGNLQALLEPTPAGHRLRLKTMKSGAVTSILGGALMAAIGAVGAGLVLWRGADAEALGLSWAMMAGGAGLFLAGALRVPSWARLRRRQMDEVAARITAMTGPE